MVETGSISGVKTAGAVPEKLAKTIRILAPQNSPVGLLAAAITLAAELHSAIGQKPKTQNK
mgnify:CR=1 FL=1